MIARFRLMMPPGMQVVGHVDGTVEVVFQSEQTSDLAAWFDVARDRFEQEHAHMTATYDPCPDCENGTILDPSKASDTNPAGITVLCPSCYGSHRRGFSIPGASLTQPTKASNTATALEVVKNLGKYPTAENVFEVEKELS